MVKYQDPVLEGRERPGQTRGDQMLLRIRAEGLASGSLGWGEVSGTGDSRQSQVPSCAFKPRPPSKIMFSKVWSEDDLTLVSVK